AKRKSTDLEPAIDAIETPDARFELVRVAGRDGRREDLHDVRHLLGVDRSVRAPLPHRLQGLTAVLDEQVVDGRDFAGGGQSGNEAGNAVHHEARLTLALAQGLFRPLALRQVEYEGRSLVLIPFEARQADEHGHPAAVLPEALPLERLQRPAP